MIVVSGLITLAPTGVAAGKAAAMEMARATRAEDGCISYAFFTSIEDESVFRVFEEWRDRDALKAHFESDHMKTWRAKLADIGVVSRAIKIYQVSGTEEL